MHFVTRKTTEKQQNVYVVFDLKKVFSCHCAEKNRLCILVWASSKHAPTPE